MAYLIGGMLGICVLLIVYYLRPAIKCIPRRQVGIPRASAIYLDKKGARMLIDEQLGLQGKPDMIFESWILRRYIPLEIKSGKLKDNEPHQGDVYQLVAYFILIEKIYGKKPPYGKLVYANKTFKIRNTAQLRKKVLSIIVQMREMLDRKTDIKVKADYIKCRHCVCKDTVCEWTKGDKHVF